MKCEGKCSLVIRTLGATLFLTGVINSTVCLVSVLKLKYVKRHMILLRNGTKLWRIFQHICMFTYGPFFWRSSLINHCLLIHLWKLLWYIHVYWFFLFSLWRLKTIMFLTCIKIPLVWSKYSNWWWNIQKDTCFYCKTVHESGLLFLFFAYN